MARQTAHHSDDLDQFMESYSARLQAMSTAQDVLTRSRWQRADLKELLSQELAQVFGDVESTYAVEGPRTELDEAATQAFSLTFHELATNALKYGHMADGQTNLSVTWSFTGAGRARMLELIWAEDSPIPVTQPERKGFGTRLIDANIIGELRGSIERHFENGGLTVKIAVPHPEKTETRKSRWRRKRREKSGSESELSKRSVRER